MKEIKPMAAGSQGGEPERRWKSWIRAAGIRAVRTVAQTAVAMIPAAVTITAVDWAAVAGTAALAGVVSLLTSLGGLPEVEG